MNKKMLLLGSGVLAVLLFLLAAYFYNQQQKEQAAQRAREHQAALVRQHAQVHGNPAAKVTIVEFFDPACETCAAFYPLVKGLIQASFGQVKLVMRYAPLHPGSDQVVKMLEAARMQGLYWQAVEALLQTQGTWVIQHRAQPAQAWEQLKTIGLDPARAQTDMNDPSVAQIVAQDIADGKTLGVDKTPGYFVNGRPLEDFGWEQLKALVASELAAVK